MDSNQKRPPEPVTPPLVLRAFYLRHNETYAPGVPGLPSALSHWSRDKHAALTCEEQKNGDVWLTNGRGERIEISVLAISYKVRGPEKLEQTGMVRRG